MRLNPHLHIVAVDGVFVEQPQGPPRFVQLPPLASIEVAELLATIRSRVVRRLTARGVLDTTQDLTLLPSDLAERDPGLAQLASAAVTGAIPAGPERRQRLPLRVVHGAASITGPLCAVDSGFSLHAATVVAHDNLRGKQALLRYVLRPPLAQQRLQQLPDGMIRLTLKRAFSDGTFAIDLDPLSLLCRLAAAVPAPGFNTVRYGGVLASAAQMRPLLIPKLASPRDPPELEGSALGNRPRCCGWRPWAELLKRAFDIDVRCARCNAIMKLKSLLTSPRSLQRLLVQLGEPTEVPGRAPSRGPPYFASQVVRRHFGEPAQLDMVD